MNYGDLKSFQTDRSLLEAKKLECEETEEQDCTMLTKPREANFVQLRVVNSGKIGIDGKGVHGSGPEEICADLLAVGKEAKRLLAGILGGDGR